MFSEQRRIGSFSLLMCLCGCLGGCLSLTSLDSSISIPTVNSAPVAGLDDGGTVEAPRRRRSGDGVDPVAVLAQRPHEQIGVATAAAPEHLLTFTAASSTSAPLSAASQRRVQSPGRQVRNADIAKRDRQAELLIRQAVRSICEGCENRSVVASRR